MAQLGRKAKRDNATTNETSEPEVNEVSTETVEPEEDFDDLMAGFSNEGDDEMTKQDTQDVNESVNEEVEAAEAAEVNEESESALSDAAKEIADRATGHTIEMLPITSLPPTVPHITGNLMTLNAIGDQIKAAVEEWNAGTAGKDGKVKRAIATLNAETDPENFERREAIARAKALIAELEEQIERDEPKLYADVEERLAKEGDTVWSEETINEKRQYISDMYAGYLQMHKATEQFIDSHRGHKSADNVGTIEQYHNKLDKPFKRVSSAGTSGVRRASGSARNVSVSDARVSYDGGVNWHRAEGQLQADGPVLSNPQFLAAEIARNSKESGNDIKSRLYATWYGDNGSADGTPISSDDVKDVSEFDFPYVTKDGSDATVKVRLTKKGATIDA